jgi:hypothetical protein
MLIIFKFIHFIFLVKIIDIFNTSSSMTLDNTLNSTFFLYSEMNNENLLINYGDSTFDTLSINSGFFYLI